MKSKQQLRTEIQAKFPINPDQHLIKSHRICDALRQHPNIQRAKTLASFYPTSTEPDITSFMSQWNGPLFLPKYNPEKRQYGFSEVHRFPSELEPGPFNIPEPVGPPSSQKTFDVILVPAVAVANTGPSGFVRLGRGSGFYDRLLSLYQGFRIGVVFEHQVVAQLPTDPHDQNLEAVIFA